MKYWKAFRAIIISIPVVFMVIGITLFILYFAVPTILKHDLFFPIMFTVVGIVSFIPIVNFPFQTLKGKYSASGYSISFNSKEIFYLLKPHKNCPQCNTKLIREKRYKYLGVGSINSVMAGSYGNGNKYELVYEYLCKECGKKYSLSELSENIKR